MVKVILKRLFRVYAHIYYQHFSEVRDLQEEAHLNTSFKHFIYFVLVSVLLPFPFVYIYVYLSVFEVLFMYKGDIE